MKEDLLFKLAAAVPAEKSEGVASKENIRQLDGVGNVRGRNPFHMV